MKVVTRKEFVSRDVTEYIAEDGRSFKSAKECNSYEKALNIEKLGGIQECISADGCTPFDGGEYMEDHSYVWYHPKNSEELARLCVAYDIENAPIEYIGDWVCIETTTYDDTSWIYSLHDSIEYAETLLDYLGFDMIVKKRGTEE